MNNINKIPDLILSGMNKLYRTATYMFLKIGSKNEKLNIVNKELLKGEKISNKNLLVKSYAFAVSFLLGLAKDWEHSKYFTTSLLILLLGFLAGFDISLLYMYGVILMLKMLNLYIQVSNKKIACTINRWWYIAWLVCPFLNFICTVLRKVTDYPTISIANISIIILWLASIGICIFALDYKRYLS